MIRIVKTTADEPDIRYKTGTKAGVKKITEARNTLIAFYDANAANINRGRKKVPFRAAIYGHKLIKKKLIALQYGKCAFCESKVIKIGHGDVEHFRPKAAYKSATGEPLRYPGYYWLAYDWQNLFFSCQLCNQKFKGNLFPLEDETGRVVHHTLDYRTERAVLLHPTDDNPSEHIFFKDEVPVPKNSSERGRQTIKLIGLDRLELNEARREALNPYRALIRIVQLYSQRTDLHGDLKTEHDEALTILKDVSLPKSQAAGEYSSMFAAFFAEPEVSALLRG
jgi:uncharacterized protein (TIGR02646 family)